MASCPTTSWQIEGDKVETTADFIFLDSKIIADGDCSHKIKTFFLKKRSYDKPRQHIKKQRHLFANKGPYSQSYVFSNSHVQMWELDHKEAYHQIIDAFKLWSKRILRVPWTSGRWKQSILKEINSKYSLEGLMLKLKIQYYGHLIRRPNSSEKIPMLGNTEDQRTRGTQRMRW